MSEFSTHHSLRERIKTFGTKNGTKVARKNLLIHRILQQVVIAGLARKKIKWHERNSVSAKNAHADQDNKPKTLCRHRRPNYTYREKCDN